MMQDVEFSVPEGVISHAIIHDSSRFDYVTDGECAGQLVRCLSGEFELFGHAGEWTIPADHMVYIPPYRMFRLRASVPASVLTVPFGRKEVAWKHDGCWVGPVNDFAANMVDYGLRWGKETSSNDRIARSYFVTLGEMLPGWFQHERIMWKPYAENSAIQRVIDYAQEQGPSISLMDAAQHAGISTRTLRRKMQTEIGQSWRDFMRELRMNRAMELLRKERLSITETAFEVGFSSSSAFSCAFADYVGKTPSAYARSFH